MKSFLFGRGDRSASTNEATKPGKGKNSNSNNMSDNKSNNNKSNNNKNNTNHKKSIAASRDSTPPGALLKEFDSGDDAGAPGVALMRTCTTGDISQGTSGDESLYASANTNTSADADADPNNNSFDLAPSELSSSAYESSYNQYLTQIENDYGVQSFESMGPGTAASGPKQEYPPPPDGTSAGTEGGPTQRRPAPRISDRFSPMSMGSPGDVHAISYVTQAPGYGYGYGQEDDLSTLGDESIIRRARENERKQRELKERQPEHRKKTMDHETKQHRRKQSRKGGAGTANAKANTKTNTKANTNTKAKTKTKTDGPNLKKAHTGSTEDMETSPRSDDLSYSFTNVMDVRSPASASASASDPTDDEFGGESRKKRERERENMVDLVIGMGGDDDTDFSKDQEPFVRKNRRKIIRFMIVLGLFLLIAAAAILIVSVLEMKKYNTATTTTSSSSNNNANSNNNNNDSNNNGTPPIFLPNSPSQPSPPTYMPPSGGVDNVITVTLPPSSSPPVPSPVGFVEESNSNVDDDLFTSLPATETPSAVTKEGTETQTPELPSASPSSFTEQPTVTIGDFIDATDNANANVNVNATEEFSAEQTKIGTDLKFILAHKSPMSLPYLDDRESAQYKAYEWMTKDQRYWNMTITTIVQRWTLAVLYHSTGGPNWKTEQLPHVYALGKQPWLSYTDECEWESSNEGSQGKTCDNDKNYFAIHLRNVGLTGTLPRELGLLSEHMRLLFFNSNELTGTLPSELGMMTGLRKLNIQYNNIGGSLPSEIGNWGMLTVASMGNNQLTGSIPSQMGMWTSVRTIGLESNRMNGTLPEQLSRLSNVEKISLEKNFFSGALPDAFNDIYQLTSLSLQNNDFTGDMPWGLCPGRYSVEELKADCGEITCDCCTECFVDPTRTKPPVASLVGQAQAQAQTATPLSIDATAQESPAASDSDAGSGSDGDGDSDSSNSSATPGDFFGL